MSNNQYDKRDSRREERRTTKLVLIGSSASLLLLLVVGAVTASNYMNDGSESSLTTRTMHSSSKSVQMICSSTDYEHTCISSMSKVVTSDTDDPKVLLKAAVTVVLNGVSNAFAHSKLLKSNDSQIRGAVQVCGELYENSKQELNATLQSIVDNGIENLPKRSHDLRIWLSAVMTYQQTCIDGFPEGELKTKMTKAMQNGKELTSNALAIVGQVSNFLATINIPGSGRRLLSSAEEEIEEAAAPVPALAPAPAPEGDLNLKKNGGYPSWVSQEDHRMLKRIAQVKLKPNITVAKDGSGNFTTISEALEAIPNSRKGRYVIYIKEGIYEEIVNVTRRMYNLTMYGDGSMKTIISGSLNYIDGTRTYHTATFIAAGHGFVGIAMAFRNTAGPEKHQAVAVRVMSDRSVFLNCRMEGYQDTLYAHTHRQFYRGCVISGTIDFVFGDAAAVFQNSLFVVRRPLSNQQNIVTAQGRTDRHESTGFVLQNCRIKADSRLLDPALPPIRSYLGRPWQKFSRTIIMESEINEFIHPQGYLKWDGDFALRTLYYAEFNNHGPGANTTSRVDWPGFRLITKNEARRYTVQKFIQGSTWIPESGATVPVRMGLTSA